MWRHRCCDTDERNMVIDMAVVTCLVQMICSSNLKKMLTCDSTNILSCSHYEMNKYVRMTYTSSIFFRNLINGFNKTCFTSLAKHLAKFMSGALPRFQQPITVFIKRFYDT